METRKTSPLHRSDPELLPASVINLEVSAIGSEAAAQDLIFNGSFVPHVGHSPFENAARRTNGRSGEAAVRHQIGWPAAALGRPCR
jgi:hypothetical protein